MKNNLSAMQRSIANASKILLGFICLILVSTGCGTTPPAALENYLFVTTTNYVPKIVSVTNTVERIVTITNTAGVVEAQPLREIIITTQTNMMPTVTSTPSVALQSWAGLAFAVANTVSPGSGGIVGLGILGAAGLFGLNRQRKLTEMTQAADAHSERAGTAEIVAQNFAQSIEVIREVLKTTPQGQALDVKIVQMLKRNQVTVGIIREAADIVANTVNNDTAKAAANRILAALPAQS